MRRWVKSLLFFTIILAITALVLVPSIVGCSAEKPKGGTTEYGTVTGMRYRSYEYIVRVETEPGSPYPMTFTRAVTEATWNHIWFGTRVKIIYTGFGREWVIGWPE